MDLTDDEWDDPNLAGLARMYRDTFHDGPCRYDPEDECIGCGRVRRSANVPDFPEIERAVAYEPKPGDMLILEMQTPMTVQQTENLRNWLRDQLGFDVVVLVLDRGRFGGVIKSDQLDEVNANREGS